MSDLGRLLEDWRSENGLSLRDAAKEIGISHNYLRILENGIDPKTKKEPQPSIEIIKLIAIKLRLPPQKIFEIAANLPKEEMRILRKDIVTALKTGEYFDRRRLTETQIKKLRKNTPNILRMIEGYIEEP